MSSRPPVARRPSAAPEAPPAPEAQKLPPNIIVLAVILIVLSFGFGYGALTVQAAISQPVASGNVACAPFAVSATDTANTVIDHLQQQHLIRNALVLKLYLKLRGKTLTVKQGSYCLSPSMHLQDIINTLSTAPAPAPAALVAVASFRSA